MSPAEVLLCRPRFAGIEPRRDGPGYQVWIHDGFPPHRDEGGGWISTALLKGEPIDEAGAALRSALQVAARFLRELGDDELDTALAAAAARMGSRP